jgi:UDP-N-acetylmuramate dehydrogenase
MGGVESFEGLLRKLARGGDIGVHRRVELSAWTALRLGGTADLLVSCDSVEAVHSVVDLLTSHGMRWLVLGAGNRVVLPDRGVRIPVLRLGGELTRWELDLDGVVAGGGANLTRLCRAAARSGLAGLGSGLAAAGTVGGAITVESRAQEPGSVSRLVDWVEVVRPGVPVRREREYHDAATDSSSRQVVVRARLALWGDDLAATIGRLDQAGSQAADRGRRCLDAVFHDPGGGSARELLKGASVPGLVVGGARVCEEDGTRVRMSRTATSSDVYKLCGIVRNRVEERYQVRLDSRLLFMDENGRELEP